MIQQTNLSNTNPIEWNSTEYGKKQKNSFPTKSIVSHLKPSNKHSVRQISNLSVADLTYNIEYGNHFLAGIASLIQGISALNLKNAQMKMDYFISDLNFFKGVNPNLSTIILDGLNINSQQFKELLDLYPNLTKLSVMKPKGDLKEDKYMEILSDWMKKNKKLESMAPIFIKKPVDFALLINILPTTLKDINIYSELSDDDLYAGLATLSNKFKDQLTSLTMWNWETISSRTFSSIPKLFPKLQYWDSFSVQSIDSKTVKETYLQWPQGQIKSINFNYAMLVEDLISILNNNSLESLGLISTQLSYSDFLQVIPTINKQTQLVSLTLPKFDLENQNNEIDRLISALQPTWGRLKEFLTLSWGTMNDQTLIYLTGQLGKNLNSLKVYDANFLWSDAAVQNAFSLLESNCPNVKSLTLEQSLIPNLSKKTMLKIASSFRLLEKLNIASNSTLQKGEDLMDMVLRFVDYNQNLKRIHLYQTLDQSDSSQLKIQNQNIDKTVYLQF